MWLENLKKGDYLEDLGVDGRIILKDLNETESEGVDCMHLAQDSDQWLALVNTVMNLWVPQKVRNFLTS
jgi:hypothetical protein